MIEIWKIFQSKQSMFNKNTFQFQFLISVYQAEQQKECVYIKFQIFFAIYAIAPITNSVVIFEGKCCLFFIIQARQRVHTCMFVMMKFIFLFVSRVIVMHTQCWFFFRASGQIFGQIYAFAFFL